MAVTTKSRSFVLTALNDVVAQPLKLLGLALVGTSMVPGDRLTVTDNDNSIIADHYVEAVNENVEFLNVPKWYGGLKLTAVPGGNWTVVARIG